MLAVKSSSVLRVVTECGTQTYFPIPTFLHSQHRPCLTSPSLPLPIKALESHTNFKKQVHVLGRVLLQLRRGLEDMRLPVPRAGAGPGGADRRGRAGTGVHGVLRGDHRAHDQGEHARRTGPVHAAHDEYAQRQPQPGLVGPVHRRCPRRVGALRAGFGLLSTSQVSPPRPVFSVFVPKEQLGTDFRQSQFQTQRSENGDIAERPQEVAFPSRPVRLVLMTIFRAIRGEQLMTFDSYIPKR